MALGASPLERARRLFHLRREWLEVQFLTLVSANGKPRGLIWSDCEFADDVIFATDRDTGQLRAFAAVAVKFEVEEGGDAYGASDGGVHLHFASTGRSLGRRSRQ